LDLEHLTKRNPFISIKKDATLFELAELLTKLRATRVRRVAVVDEVGLLSSISFMAFQHLLSSISSTILINDGAER